MSENLSSSLAPDPHDRSAAFPETTPDSAPELLSQALALHQGNRLAEAAAIYRQVLAILPDHPQAGFNLGTICQAGGDLPAAILSYRQILRREPKNFQVLYFLANALGDQGCWEEAIVTYQQAIRVEPTHADAHYNLGILHYRQGEQTQAMACYREAVKLDPAHAASLYNLGIIHFERQEYEAAAGHYEQALAARPDDVDTLYNLAFTRAKQGQLAAAALHYHAAVELAPADAELHNALGSTLRKLEEPELAESCYRQAVNLRPDYGSAWTNLATILHLLGRYEEAMDCYSRAIELGDRTESADYMLAALTGSNRQTSPRSYVRDLFDGYAEEFDHCLVDNLEYHVPEMLKNACRELVGAGHRFRRAADLGCGTGLAGVQFRGMVEHLAGVDLAEKMVAKAAARGIYDHLCCSDLSEFLAEKTAPDFDLLFAADVLIYLGDLESFFSQARQRLAPGGYLCFSTEKLTAAGDYRLQKTGRYAHSAGYLRALAARHGFRVEICREISPRKEKDVWLQGYLLILRRD
ncbi:MAG: tetratricopeptide repeat protein [Desulfobulbaceae bacterium]|nr:tetratricopeptide repeat protein [Desulfobulbaceae bacterium]